MEKGGKEPLVREGAKLTKGLDRQAEGRGGQGDSCLRLPSWSAARCLTELVDAGKKQVIGREESASDGGDP